MARLKRKQPRSPAAVAKALGQACSVCEQHHPKCNGHAGDPPRPCANAPINGGDVCHKHGGSAPQVRRAAAERREIAAVEGKMAELLREADLPHQHPIDGLLELVRRSSAMVAVLGDMVAKLEDEMSLDWYEDDEGKRHYFSKGDSLYGLDHNSDQAPHVLYSMYLKEREHFGRVCKLALDANIDERLVRNAERSGQVMFDVITESLRESDLTPAQTQQLMKNIAQRLRGLNDPFSAPAITGGARGRAS